MGRSSRQLAAGSPEVVEVEHHAALPWRKIGTFVAELAEENGISALALRFAILTVTRTGELIGARWSEFDMSDAVGTVPAARVKASPEPRVSLSDDVLEVLREAASLCADQKADCYVFPGGEAAKPLSSMALLMPIHAAWRRRRWHTRCVTRQRLHISLAT